MQNYSINVISFHFTYVRKGKFEILNPRVPSAFQCLVHPVKDISE